MFMSNDYVHHLSLLLHEGKENPSINFGTSMMMIGILGINVCFFFSFFIENEKGSYKKTQLDIPKHTGTQTGTND